MRAHTQTHINIHAPTRIRTLVRTHTYICTLYAYVSVNYFGFLFVKISHTKYQYSRTVDLQHLETAIGLKCTTTMHEKIIKLEQIHTSEGKQ